MNSTGQIEAAVPGGRERQVDGGEEEIREGEADDEGGGGVGAQLPTPQQRHHRQQVPCHKAGTSVSCFSSASGDQI